MKGEDFLESFVQGVCGGFVDVPQPFLEIQKHLFGIGIGVLLKGCSELPVSMIAVFPGKMSLDISIFVNGATLVDELFSEPFLKGL